MKRTFSESSKKAETFSLGSKPFMPIEVHVDVGFKEVEGTKIAAGEPSDRILKNKGQAGDDPNQPLCPLLPAVKRNKKNMLAFSLEGGSSDKKLNQ